MAFVLAERVRETTLTTGTGTIDLAGATLAMRTFVAGIGNGNSTRYLLVSGNGVDWEIGTGTVTDASPDTLSRTPEISTNGNAAISLTGESRVSSIHPANVNVLPDWTGKPRGLYSQIRSETPTAVNTGLSTWGNQDSAVVNDGETGICITGAVNANDISIRHTNGTVPSTPYTITALIATESTDVVNAFGAVFGWYDGTKIEVIALYNRAGGAAGSEPQINVLDYATLTSAAGAANVRFAGSTRLTRAWFSITDDGTNVTFKYLPEGNAANAETLYTVAKASGYLGASGYSSICFGVARRGAGSIVTLPSWKQS
jgi:hypothetical protein